MSHKMSFIIVSLVIALLVGCAAPGPTTYTEMSVPMLIMLKPAGGADIRVTARWMGPNGIGAPNGYFTGTIADTKSDAIYFLCIPKSMAGAVSQLPQGSVITVEGQVMIGRGIASGAIQVERFVN